MKQKLLSLFAFLMCVLSSNAADVTFDFSKPTDYGYTAPTSGTDVNIGQGNKISTGNVSITITKDGKSTKTIFHLNTDKSIELRTYSGAVLTIATTDNSLITEMVFAGKTVSGFALSPGTYTSSSKSWSGSTNSITMTMSGTAKISTLKVTTKSATAPADPTVSPAGGFFTTAQTVTVTPATGTTAYYTTDGTDPTSASTAYTAPISITKTTTLKVIAYKGTEASGIVTNTYTFPVVVSTIANLKKLASGTVVQLTLTGAKVLFTNTKNSNTETFVRDNTGAVCFYNTGTTLQTNDDISGTIIGEFNLTSASLPELVAYDTYTKESDLTREAGTDAEPLLITALPEDVSSLYCNLVKIEKQTCSSSDVILGLTAYNKFSKCSVPYTNALVDATGIVYPYLKSSNVVDELCPIAADGFVYHFDENITNTLGAVSSAKVALTRTLKGNQWNTFCVPFALTADQISAAFGADVKITEFSGVDGSTMLFTAATAIVAGKPYLMKPAADVVDPVFNGIALTTTVSQTITNGDYSFAGTYDPKALATDGTNLFAISDQLYVPAVGTETIKGMRAYFIVPASAPAAKLNIGGETTDIHAINGAEMSPASHIYNLNGQFVGTSADALQKGIYIVNGKKIVRK